MIVCCILSSIKKFFLKVTNVLTFPGDSEITFGQWVCVYLEPPPPRVHTRGPYVQRLYGFPRQPRLPSCILVADSNGFFCGFWSFIESEGIPSPPGWHLSRLSFKPGATPAQLETRNRSRGRPWVSDSGHQKCIVPSGSAFGWISSHRRCKVHACFLPVRHSLHFAT